MAKKKEFTPKQLKKAKAAAKKRYIEEQGICSVRVLSRAGKVPEKYIREWMKEENWSDIFKEEPGDRVKLTKQTKEILQSAAEEYGLNEQEELFCYHYLKTFNQTTAAIRAGYGASYAHNQAYYLLEKPQVKRYLEYVKGQRNSELFIDSMRIIKEYMKIAFADMTDFISFDSNGVVLKNSNRVDGQLITKLTEGKAGTTVELADKMKALEKLEQYLGVMPSDEFKRRMEEERLLIQKQRLELDRSKTTSETKVEDRLGMYLDLLTGVATDE